jgi:hypothetical protein
MKEILHWIKFAAQQTELDNVRQSLDDELVSICMHEILLL